MNEHKIIEVENEKSDSEDHLIIESVNKFLEKDVKPYVKEFESQDKYPQDIADKMADLGLFGATISPEYGGLGLSDNQIGEDKSVCVVNVTEPFFLQNPKIVKKEKEIVYKEGCLSIPDKMITTKRYEKIWVKADNIEDEMYFGPQKEKKFDFKTNSYTANDLLILEAVCVQHEIDHLNGLTIYDREHILEQYKRTERKIGRNEKVTITKDKETLTLKYKKAIPYLEKGWIING